MKPRAIDLTPELDTSLRRQLRGEMSAAIQKHREREDLYTKWYDAYKRKPKQSRKMFPWPDASNVIVPIVSITVDTITARLQKAMLGAKDFCEVEIKNPQWEPAERALRDWVRAFITSSGARDRLRTAFFDMVLYGNAYVKPQWIEETRLYHAYDDSGNVIEQDIPDYKGVRWSIVAPRDVLLPDGFDEWDQLPWIANRLSLTWPELSKLEKVGFYTNIEQLRDSAPETASIISRTYELYEVFGTFELDDDQFEECILTYSYDADKIVRAVYNPFFGKARHFVSIPFLQQSHELYATGAAEQVITQQEEASTIHNQVIDAATAANAGIIVTSPDADLGQNQEIFPGKHIVTQKPREDVAIYHLSEASPTLRGMEQQAAFYAEKSSGASSYSMGVESQIAGSRATATGTTALISEGNIRFWVSIDDARHAIQELLYLTLQLEQQFRPEGLQLPDGSTFILPQGDIRTSIGLKLTLTSESVNRDLELQNMQLLMGVLNEYYMRLMQAGAMVLNPQFPPEQKALALQVMTSSQNIVRRFVERFDIENIDQVVPNLLALLQNGQGQATPMAGALPPGPQGMAPRGPGQGIPSPQAVGPGNGSMAGAGQGPVPGSPAQTAF